MKIDDKKEKENFCFTIPVYGKARMHKREHIVLLQILTQEKIIRQ